MKELVSRYWICSTCAMFLGIYKELYGVTCISGRCGYCESEEEQTLIPVSDFTGEGWD